MCFPRAGDQPVQEDPEMSDDDLPHWGEFPTDDPNIIAHVVETQENNLLYFTSPDNYHAYMSGVS